MFLLHKILIDGPVCGPEHGTGEWCADLQPAGVDGQLMCRIVQALALSLQVGIAGTLCWRGPEFHPGVLPQHVDEPDSEQAWREDRSFKFYSNRPMGRRGAHLIDNPFPLESCFAYCKIFCVPFPASRLITQTLSTVRLHPHWFVFLLASYLKN